MTTEDIRQRLLDPDATFTAKDLYQAFEALAETYGFHRSPDLPPKDLVAETASLTVPGFEKFGVIIVKPRTARDSLITIPSVVDKMLGDNFQPSQNTGFNASLIALAKTVIISPVGIVETVLQSSDDADLAFFFEFAKTYAEWMTARGEAIAKKNSGKTSLKKSPSSSEINETSSQPIPDGST